VLCSWNLENDTDKRTKKIRNSHGAEVKLTVISRTNVFAVASQLGKSLVTSCEEVTRKLLPWNLAFTAFNEFDYNGHASAYPQAV